MDEFEPTTFEHNPWGARQRVLPRSTFRVAPPTQHLETTATLGPPIVVPSACALPVVTPDLEVASIGRWLATLAWTIAGATLALAAVAAIGAY
jgi:hypothetical protein